MAVDGGCHPRDFWDLSLAEAYVFAGVVNDREERDVRRTAWLIASVGNIAGAKPKLTVDKVLGKKTKGDGRALEAALSTMVAGAIPLNAPRGDQKAQAREQYDRMVASAKALARSKRKATDGESR